MSQIKALTVQQNNNTLLCTAVGSGSYQSVSETFAMCGRSGNILKRDKAVVIFCSRLACKDLCDPISMDYSNI